MGLSEKITEIAKNLQKVDNMILYQQLIDLSTQALELQSENAKLQNENADLKKELEIADDIERYSEIFVTRKSDSNKIMYCAHCWDAEHKLIQLQCYDSGNFKCPHCKTHGAYDREASNLVHRVMMQRLSNAAW